MFLELASEPSVSERGALARGHGGTEALTSYVVELDDGSRFRVDIDSAGRVRVDESERDVDVVPRKSGRIAAGTSTGIHVVCIFHEGEDLVIETSDGERRRARISLASADLDRRLAETLSKSANALEVRGDILAPIAGSVSAMLVGQGERVSRGQPVFVLEAMKMFNEIVAPVAGVVELFVSPGDTVRAGVLMAAIRPD